MFTAKYLQDLKFKKEIMDKKYSHTFFDSEIKRTLRLTIILFFIVVVFLSSAIFWMARTKYQFSKIYTNSYPLKFIKEEVCKEGLKSIFKGSPNPHLMTKEILESLKKEPFLIEVEKVLLVDKSNKDQCRVLIKGERLFGFQVSLTNEAHAPFKYKIHAIEEIESEDI